MESEFHQHIAPRPTPPTPNTRLDPEIENKMLTDFDLLWEQIGKEETQYYDSEEIDAKRVKMLEREKTFVSKVTEVTLELSKEHEGTITLLFDVDETIAKNLLFSDPPMTVVRPAFEAVIKNLDKLLPGRIEVGLLTSRGQSHLDEERTTPSYLTGVQKYVNPIFLVSSRDGNIVTKNEDMQVLDYGNSDDKKRLPFVETIIKPEIKQAIQEHGEYTKEWHWFDKKLAVLAILVQQHPERAFVFVDDMAFAESIVETGDRVRGIRVYEDAGFFLP